MMMLDIVDDSGEGIIIPDGATISGSDSQIAMYMESVFRCMPLNHTLFKEYDPKKNEYTIEIYDLPRDFNTSPVWSCVFARVQV